MSLSETSPGRKVSQEIIRNKKYKWEKMLGYISNSLEDSTLEIHLQSPVCGPVSPRPRWSPENLSRDGSKEDLDGGGVERNPLRRGLPAKNMG